MSHLEIQSTGEFIASQNGDITEDAKWNLDYDGKNLELETIINNDYSYTKLNNDEIIKLFDKLNHNSISLENRLNSDFPLNKMGRKKTVKKVRFAPIKKSSKNKIKIYKNPKDSKKKTKRKYKKTNTKRNKKYIISNEEY